MRTRKSGQVATARKQAHSARSNENTMRKHLAEISKERDRLRKAIIWALGAGDDFREQGTMDGKYWWRGELAQRAGLEWDGKKYATVKTANAEVSGAGTASAGLPGYAGDNNGDQE